MGPKPVAGEDQTGFSPDDRNTKKKLNNANVWRLTITLYNNNGKLTQIHSKQNS